VLVDAPIGFSITQNGLKTRKIWGWNYTTKEDKKPKK
jgi:hypothetical protein